MKIDNLCFYLPIKCPACEKMMRLVGVSQTGDRHVQVAVLGYACDCGRYIEVDIGAAPPDPYDEGYKAGQVYGYAAVNPYSEDAEAEWDEGWREGCEEIPF